MSLHCEVLLTSLSGNEIGPFKAIEESTLATLIPSEDRSTIFAWYAVFSGLAASLGSLSGGWTTQYLQEKRQWSVVQSYRLIFAMYSVWGLAKSLLSLCLSKGCEVHQEPQNEEERRLLDGSTPERPSTVSPQDAADKKVFGLSPDTRSKVVRVGALFGLDNLASGLVPL